MSKIDEGGYVYPPMRNYSEEEGGYVLEEGITRRDWLIGNILKGLVGNPNIMNNDKLNEIATGLIGGKFIVKCAERLADLTIERGNNKQN